MALTTALMRKHLLLLNKHIREDLSLRGISKMKKEQVKKNFDVRFEEFKGFHVPTFNYRFGDLQSHIKEYKKLSAQANKKKSAPPAPKKKSAPPAPKKKSAPPAPKKKRVVKKKNGDLMISAPTSKPAPKKKRVRKAPAPAPAPASAPASAPAPKKKIKFRVVKTTGPDRCVCPRK